MNTDDRKTIRMNPGTEFGVHGSPRIEAVAVYCREETIFATCYGPEGASELWVICSHGTSRIPLDGMPEDADPGQVRIVSEFDPRVRIEGFDGLIARVAFEPSCEAYLIGRKHALEND